MESADFSEGAKNLEKLLAEGNVVIFCAEKLPWRATGGISAATWKKKKASR